ncbi:hypothetical protein CR513_53681, partial [Mucuna pruriens]
MEVQPKTPAITNIVGTRGVTKSGHVFVPENLRKENLIKEKHPEIPLEMGKKKGKAIEGEEKGKEEIFEEEAAKFLKFICQSEYELIDQLNHTLANISLLLLLMNLEIHRKLLLKVLSEAHMARDITLDKFGGIIGNIMVNNHLTFLEEEILAEGRGNNHALRISIKCMDHILVRRVKVVEGFPTTSEKRRLALWIPSKSRLLKDFQPNSKHVIDSVPHRYASDGRHVASLNQTESITNQVDHTSDSKHVARLTELSPITL